MSITPGTPQHEAGLRDLHVPCGLGSLSAALPPPRKIRTQDSDRCPISLECASGMAGVLYRELRGYQQAGGGGAMHALLEKQRSRKKQILLRACVYGTTLGLLMETTRALQAEDQAEN